VSLCRVRVLSARVGHLRADGHVAYTIIPPPCPAEGEESNQSTMPEVMFAGPDGRLEGRYHHSKEAGAPLALVLHPHPLHGGTMNNRITFTMYQSFQKLGFSVMRFNFRGVGRSQGRYDGGIGEISDAAAALDWMQMVNPASGGLWIAGYSFGAFVGMQLLMRRPEISGWVSVAPPASHYDFGFLAPCPCGGLMRRRRTRPGTVGPQAGRQTEHAEERPGGLSRLSGCGPRVRRPRRSSRRSARGPRRHHSRPQADGPRRRLIPLVGY
jgi:alpha/beta superfamily hydrolase